MKTIIFFTYLIFVFGTNLFAQTSLSIITPSEGQVFILPPGQSNMDIYVSWSYILEYPDGPLEYFQILIDNQILSTTNTNITVPNISSGSKICYVIMWYWRGGYLLGGFANVGFTVGVSTTADNNFTARNGTHGSIKVDGVQQNNIPTNGYTFKRKYQDKKMLLKLYRLKITIKIIK